jgi:hypothetical protein
MREAGAGHLVLAEEHGVGLAAGAAVSFGATGWLAGITVRRQARRRGLGTAITEAAIAWLRERGARTILLLATAGGQRVYEQLEFEPEGRYLVFAPRGSPPRSSRAARAGVRPLAPDDREVVLALDRWATAEDRSPALEACFSRGLVAPRAGAPAAAAVACPWPSGHAIARDPAAGATLLDGLWREGGASYRAVVPEANDEALAALRQRGFRVVDHVLRMRSGEPVDWHPEGIWGAFNLAWG